MATNIMTLAGVGESAKKPKYENCRCVFNKRTKRGVQICEVPKSKKHRSGLVFTGSCTNPVRTK
ncbi:MAG: hypothetical protein ACREJC_04495 [Tepidisphaeraceae bacterium]